MAFMTAGQNIVSVGDVFASPSGLGIRVVKVAENNEFISFFTERSETLASVWLQVGKQATHLVDSAFIDWMCRTCVRIESDAFDVALEPRYKTHPARDRVFLGRFQGEDCYYYTESRLCESYVTHYKRRGRMLPELQSWISLRMSMLGLL